MIGGDYQYPLEQQDCNYEEPHASILQTLASTIELLGQELFRVKISTTSAKVSAHDSRFNTKLESTVKALERMASLKICHLQSATDVLRKILYKTDNRIAQPKAKSGVHSARRHSENKNQKLFIIGGGK